MTTSTWISQVGPYPVKRIELPFGGSDVRTWGKGVLHTTEGWGADSAVDHFRASGFCPHFTVGAKEKGGPAVIYQHRSLATRSTTLRSGGSPDNNVAARCQIEAVGFSQTSLWRFDPTTWDPLVQLLAWLARDLQPEPIPLSRPAGYRDDCSDIQGTWATTANSRRNDQLLQAPNFRGWLMHLEAVANTHWDAGALRWTDLLADARAVLGGGGSTDEEDDMGTANDYFDKAKAAGVSASDFAGNESYFTGYRYARRRVALPERLASNPDAKLGFADGVQAAGLAAGLSAGAAALAAPAPAAVPGDPDLLDETALGGPLTPGGSVGPGSGYVDVDPSLEGKERPVETDTSPKPAPEPAPTEPEEPTSS